MIENIFLYVKYFHQKIFYIRKTFYIVSNTALNYIDLPPSFRLYTNLPYFQNKLHSRRIHLNAIEYLLGEIKQLLRKQFFRAS